MNIIKKFLEDHYFEDKLKPSETLLYMTKKRGEWEVWVDVQRITNHFHVEIWNWASKSLGKKETFNTANAKQRDVIDKLKNIIPSEFLQEG